MSMDSGRFLSIVIPAFNEEQRLRKSLPLVREFLARQNYPWEVVVVDDGSSDNTRCVPHEIFSDSEARVLVNPKNLGKGYSVKRGVMEARGRVIYLCDADLSTPIEEFETLYSWLDRGYDIVIGSRSLAGSEVPIRQAWYREAMGRIFNVFVQMLVLRGFVDTQCGFKCFKREVALPIVSQMTVHRFSFDVEFLVIAGKRGLKIKEVPVLWRDVPTSRVRLFTDSTRMFLDLLRIRRNDKKGIYR